MAVPVPSGWCGGSAGLRCRALATRIGLGGPPQIAVNSAALLGDPCMLKCSRGGKWWPGLDSCASATLRGMTAASGMEDGMIDCADPALLQEAFGQAAEMMNNSAGRM